jgi:TrmH family RNA methyltransferase
MSAPLSRARKLLQSRNRRRSGQFLAEGPHVVREALRAGLAPTEVFVSEDARSDDVQQLADELLSSGVRVHLLAPRDLQEIAETRTPQGIVAVVPEPPPPAEPFAVPGLWLLLDRVQDPGNVGTLLRAAEAFGARGAVALRGTVDLWSGKAVRAGQGAHFHLSLLQAEPGAADTAVLDEFRAAGGAIWVAEASGESIYDAPAPPRLCMVAVGNEAGGVADALAARAQRSVAVPQRGRAESLNVAMAGAVILSWLAHGDAPA